MQRDLSKKLKISARQHHQSTASLKTEESAFKTFIKMENNNQHIVMPHLDSNATMRNATTIIEVKESQCDGGGKSLNALQLKYDEIKRELSESQKRIEELQKSLEVI